MVGTRVKFTSKHFKESGGLFGSLTVSVESGEGKIIDKILDSGNTMYLIELDNGSWTKAYPGNCQPIKDKKNLS